MSTDTGITAGPPGEVATSLERSINWRGAFVMGLAGVILVTGITPFAVQAMGAAAIPALIGIQIIALVVCLTHGRVGRTLAAPHGRDAVLRLRGVQTTGGVNGPPYWRRRWLELLAGVVPGSADQHDPGVRLYRYAVSCPPGKACGSPRWSRFARGYRGADHHAGRTGGSCSYPATWGFGSAPASPPYSASSRWCRSRCW